MGGERRKNPASKVVSGQGGASGKRRVPWLLIAAAALLAWGGYTFWQGRTAASSFDRYLVQGRGIELAVEEQPSHGSTHLQPGADFRYGESIPTSGPHSPYDLKPGFYTKPQPLERLVHNLEHGNIVIYYDQANSATLRLLRSWTRTFGGPMDGLIVAPMEGLGSRVVLTAWQKKLVLDPFDPVTAAVFIDAYRGRGPESSVR